MSSHLRRVTSAERSALPGETNQQKFLPLGGEVVGTSGGDYIVHFAGEDRPGLVGAFEAASWDDLHPATKPNVLEAEWEEPSDPEDPESPPVRVRGKKKDVPVGVEPIETDIIPHYFA